MVLFSQQVRLLDDESIDAHITSDSTQATNVDWTTKGSRGLVLAKEQFVYLKGVFIAASAAYGAGRIRIDGVPIVTTGGFTNASKTIHAVVRLPAGSYTITWQVAMWAFISGGMTLDALKIGLFNFVDNAFHNYDGSLSIADTETGTVVDQTVTLPSERQLPFGVTKECAVIISVFGVVDVPTGQRANDLQNNEVNPASGRSGWRVYVDDVQQDWSEVAEDFADGDTSNPTYGEGSFGRLAIVKDVGTTFNLKVKAMNNRGSTLTHKAYVRAVMCVWFLQPDMEPVTINNLPLQSTLYLSMEPVWANPNKTLALGKTRIEDFGVDNYSTDSGAGIVDWNYTFELVDPFGCQLFVGVAAVTDWGACVSMWGADIREG